MYKQFCTCSNPDKRLELYLKFEKYRNSIVALTRTCKEDYYKDYFETNKKDVKKIWNGLRNLINIKKSNKTSKQIMLNINEKTTTDNKITANHFDEFFTSIAGKLHRFFIRILFIRITRLKIVKKLRIS